MTSQLRQNFQASQAAHGAIDITTLHLYSQVNSLSVGGPQVNTLFYYRWLKYPTFFYLLENGVKNIIYVRLPEQEANL